MFEKFTDRARRVVVLAQDEARMLNHNHIGTEHVLLGLVHEADGIAARALESSGITLGPARRQAEEIVGKGPRPPGGQMPFTSQAKSVLEFARQEALQLGDVDIDTVHVLLGLIREGEDVGAQIVVKLGADLARVRLRALQMLSGAPGAQAEEQPAADQFGTRLDRIENTLTEIVERLAAIEKRLPGDG